MGAAPAARLRPVASPDAAHPVTGLADYEVALVTGDQHADKGPVTDRRRYGTGTVCRSSGCHALARAG